jgi:transcriptional repressor NrdR
MKCPYCRHSKSRVVDKRNAAGLEAIRRRRECLACGRRFSTYERIELAGFSVIKKDGRREGFDREKLLAGLLKACEKRPVPREAIEELVERVQSELGNREGREVPAAVIGEMVMDWLAATDKVAYIRFASVYREFADLSSFERELKTLKKKTM